SALVEDLGVSTGFAPGGDMLTSFVVWIAAAAFIGRQAVRAANDVLDLLTKFLDLSDRATMQTRPIGDAAAAEEFARKAIARQWSADGGPMVLELRSIQRSDDGSCTLTLVNESWTYQIQVIDTADGFVDRYVIRLPLAGPS